MKQLRRSPGRVLLVLLLSVAPGAARSQTVLFEGPIRLSNALPSLDNAEADRRRLAQPELPMVVPPFEEHRRLNTTIPADATVKAVHAHQGTVYALDDSGAVYRVSQDRNWSAVGASIEESDQLSAGIRLARHLEGSGPRGQSGGFDGSVHAESGGWLATSGGLLSRNNGDLEAVADLPVRGINDVLVASDGDVWVASSQGLFQRTSDGQWTHIRGQDGLPVEETTCLAADGAGRLWIGTRQGVVLYDPSATGRQWYYRAGQRFLPHDRVIDITVSPDDHTVWVLSPAGVSAIEIRQTTLLEKAEAIEERIGQRHRRLGLVGETTFAAADNQADYVIEPGPNDGLWTAYHVAAMSLCYAATGSEAAKASATKSMESLYMLQNATGIPGLPARSVVPRDAGKPSDRWRLTPDERFWWYTDTSSDEIDGHYLAFYTFWEHIARDDERLRDRHVKQTREMTSYIVDNGYRLLDWDGERTRWGFWDPASLNEDPSCHLENGLNSLQILSFLRVAHHVTGDDSYLQHYRSLIVDHGYLDNVLLEKKVFPDQVNHSDDQLAYVAWYPLLQLATDPQVRTALQKAVRRHYLIEEPERASFFFFVSATIDPEFVNIAAAVEQLRNITPDRRNWKATNSHRDDVTFAPRRDRFDKKQLTHVLPADERHFDRWNDNPYLADDGADGTVEDNGAAYLLPYWMGRYHGFIAEVPAPPAPGQ